MINANIHAGPEKPLVLKCDLDGLRRRVAPLYHHYAGKDAPQSAHIAIDCERAIITVGYNHEYGPAEPEEVCYGRTRWYEVPAEVAGTALADLLESSTFRTLAERVYHGIKIVWDGNAYVAKTNADAAAAEERIEEMLLELETSEPVWYVDDWLSATGPLESYWRDEPLQTAVQALQAQAENERVVLDGDIETALLEAAFAAFQGGEGLNTVHVQTLLERGMIGATEVEQWQQDARRHLPVKVVLKG